ncbi:MAG: Na+/H+ antiporter NhaC [Calditrichaeota bacterium]|nr:Na+/H+ antiporter NhaC [Calditrichota bacterium]RQV99047.1 MAG: Na+/H+ antiporter NhaC [Calditrichota bacterium]
MTNQVKKEPGLLVSVIPLIVIVVLLIVGYGIFRIGAEVLLVIAAFITGLLARSVGFSWDEMQKGIVESITKALPAMLIVITVGILIGSWIVSGTIPMLIYYGLKLISPKFFLFSACLVCSIISVFTGTSWGTVGTVGIAFIGVADGLNIPLPQAAGAIIAGAYFGDKLSPFSDTTNLAPIAARSNLFDHIRHMLWTTLPAWLIGMFIYLMLGFLSHSGQQLALPESLMEGIRIHFSFNILLLLPPLLILYFAVRKLPTIPGMLFSSFLAVILALFFQKVSFSAALSSLTTGYVSNTGMEDLDKLLTRGGMMSMMGVTLIAFCAFGFAGIMQVTGMLNQILNSLTKVTRSTGSLVASTVFSCISVAIMTGSSFLSIIIPGELFAPLYKQRGLAAKNLSRTTEDSGTVVVPLVPWSMAAVFMSGTLGVGTLDYLPWTFMNYTGFLFALIYGFTGIGIAPKIREDETQAGS